MEDKESLFEQVMGTWVDSQRPSDPQDRFVEHVVVSRHQGLIDWLWRHDLDCGTVVSHATAEDVRGKVVYGVLPFDLAAEAREIWVVSMPGLTPEQRGKDLTPEEMDAAGAHLEGFKIIRLP